MKAAPAPNKYKKLNDNRDEAIQDYKGTASIPELAQKWGVTVAQLRNWMHANGITREYHRGTPSTPPGLNATCDYGRKFAENFDCLVSKSGKTFRMVSLEMGREASASHHWRTGYAFPKVPDLPVLAKVLGCTMADLFAGF